MKKDNSSIQNLLNEEEYKLKKLRGIKEDQRYIIHKMCERASLDMSKISKIAKNISNHRFASRLYDKLIERKMDVYIHDDYVTEINKTPEGVFPTGKFLDEFEIDRSRDGIHIFGEVRLSKSADRILDFVIILKKGHLVKKFAIECQTNIGHLKPMEKHRDCVLGREITLKTDFTFLEYSSVEIFYDNNISSLDEFIDELEFGSNPKFYDKRIYGVSDKDIPF